MAIIAQEILEREGYLIFDSIKARQIPCVVENNNPRAYLPVGTTLVLIGEVSETEACAFSQRNGLYKRATDSKGRRICFYYKAVAE
jgi:hypothetical protein